LSLKPGELTASSVLDQGRRGPLPAGFGSKCKQRRPMATRQGTRAGGVHPYQSMTKANLLAGSIL
jgi:hypothetical protein